MTSQLKTLLLLSLLTGVVVVLGRLMGGPTGMVIAFGFALVMNVGSYWYSDKLVLRMYKAREVGPGDAPALHKMVDELCMEANLPKPKVYIIPQEAPNAFATGRNPENAAVAFTDGIMRMLTPDELRGVVAHELAHIKNRDILVQSVAAVLGGAIVMMANILQFSAIFGSFGGNDEEGGGSPLAALAMAFLAPMAAMLIQMAISRTREYKADATGAAVSHDPMALAGALQKLEAYSQRIPMRGANPATENMFIVNPLGGSKMAGLFATHPPIPERVARLKELAAQRSRQDSIGKTGF